MEAIFTLVKALGNNNPAGVVKLLRDDLLDSIGQREAYLRSLFSQDESIEYDQFHKAMKQFGVKYATTLEQMTEKLMQRAPPVLRDFNSDRDLPAHCSTGISTETETELSSETFFNAYQKPSHS